ncbi:MAG: YibE/F family protein [Erysipelotrichaceae bacterium]|nr:YibE/F family protein [Erysipelotrichaceae bacterium]
MKKDFRSWYKNNAGSMIVILICIICFILCAFWANMDSFSPETEKSDYAEYENGKVLEVLSDNTFQDDAAEGAYRGEQMLTVLVTTGRYKGETLLVYNYVGPVYSVPVKSGDRITMIISTYNNGEHNATVYEVNRLPGIIIMLAIFSAVVILVGGKNGAKSLIGLIFVALSLFLVLLPALMKGAPTIPMTFVTCVFVAAFSLTVLSGFNRKSVCAFLGTVFGVATALLFAYMAQLMLRLSGLRQEYAEALLQLNQMGYHLGLKGLLSAGVIISSLGAVMDVSMGLASSVNELHETDRTLDFKRLFTSAMNIGKDMVGTMTNTLVLAFLGSGFVLILYLYSLSLGKYQLLSSAYLSIELISALASSIGTILSVPITAFIAARAYAARQEK